jgi:hypothetical protein
MVKAEEWMQRYIVEPHETSDPNLRKEPFIRDSIAIRRASAGISCVRC